MSCFCRCSTWSRRCCCRLSSCCCRRAPISLSPPTSSSSCITAAMYHSAPGFDAPGNWEREHQSRNVCTTHSQSNNAAYNDYGVKILSSLRTEREMEPVFGVEPAKEGKISRPTYEITQQFRSLSQRRASVHICISWERPQCNYLQGGGGGGNDQRGLPSFPSH